MGFTMDGQPKNVFVPLKVDNKPTIHPMFGTSHTFRFRINPNH
jgi:hypothetical protein